LLDLGTQEPLYDHRPQVRLGFELLDERNAEGKCYLIGQSLTFSSHPNSTFRSFIEAWLGRPVPNFSRYDLTERVGAVAIVGLQHGISRSGHSFARIVSLALPPVGVPMRQKPEIEPVIFNLKDFDPEIYGRLPDWLKTVISRSPEYRRAVNQHDRLAQSPPRLTLASVTTAPARHVRNDDTNAKGSASWLGADPSAWTSQYVGARTESGGICGGFSSIFQYLVGRRAPSHNLLEGESYVSSEADAAAA
jgi:hypothetical protein